MVSRRKAVLRYVLWALVVAGVVAAAGPLVWTRLTKTAPPDAFLGAVREGQPELRLHFPTVVDLAVGENRFAFGFTNREARLLTDSEITAVTIGVYDLSGDEPRVVETVSARFLRPGWREISSVREYTNPNVLVNGFFKTVVRFARPGGWGLEFLVRRPGRKPFSQRIRVNVLSESATPPVGAPAPRSRNPTLEDVGGDLSKVDSDPRLKDVGMHRVSIADSIAAGRPSVILFSTPGLCETRICLPNTEILYSLYPQYGDRVDFIHIEIYQNFEKYQDRILGGALESEPADLELRDAVKEWGLENDPWLFFVDGQGRIFAKFFGPVARSEVVETLRRLVSKEQQGKGPG